MNTISTSTFEFVSPAQPEQVWAALTRADLTARYFFGMTAVSDWRPGDPVVFTPSRPGPMYSTLHGEVLAAEEGRRLSYSLGSGDGHPTTYVTWQVSEADGGTGARVRLYVDETERPQGLDGDEDGDVQRSWGQVVSALQGVLAALPLA